MRPSGGIATNVEARFWVEFRVVRIIWKRLLAVVPILNDGNIYFDSNIVSLGMMILAICKVWDVILALILAFMRFERHFDGISGGSI